MWDLPEPGLEPMSPALAGGFLPLRHQGSPKHFLKVSLARIKKALNIYTMEYYSAIKKNEIMPFAATWMDLEVVIWSEVSQTEKEKYDLVYMWNLKGNDANELIYRTETDSQT